MPDTREDPSEDSHSTGSSWRIVNLWRKFHFSGRVIMCSVLLGLGLILIGGLIFVINMNDTNVNKTKSDGSPDVPTKAPANYSGPVVMGIGTFIVTVGVIMCLFETQVCRKKTADSKPLISESAEDAEKKVSDPASVPSTSHGHKTHRHGARKASSSPRKHKSRHGKSHSRERNQQKSPSPKSLPVSIGTPRYLTSSGENFLTPPNTLDEHTKTEKEHDSRNADDKNASLMKSFNSSGPSWNQSAEFLTPSTSFRDASLSLNNSIEIDPSHGDSNVSTELAEKQLIPPEYFTPLTVEEDRIQQLLMRVKSEQKQMNDTIQPAKTPEDLKSESDLSSSLIQKKVGKGSDGNEKEEHESSVPEKQQSTEHSDSLISKEDKLKNLETEDPNKLDENKCEKIIPETKVESKISETFNTALNKNNIVSEVKDLPAPTNQQEEVYKDDPLSDSEKPGDHNLESSLDKEALNSQEDINEPQNDFDSSVSSNETVVSPDSFQENLAKTNITAEKELSPVLKEDLRNKDTNDLSTPELKNNDETRQNKDSGDQINTQANAISSDKIEAIHPNIGANEPVETLNVNKDAFIKVAEKVSKDGSS